MSAPAIKHSTTEALRFLKSFAPEGPWALTAIDPDTRANITRTYPPDQEHAAAAWIEERQGTRNIYFSVNRPKTLMRKKAKKSDIASMLALHVDLDPREGFDLNEERERILSALRAFAPAPSIILFSGGGYQAFWLLKEPMPANDVPRLEAYNRHLENVPGGDHCHNIDRIMRLPGTVNIPNQRKRDKGRSRVIAKIIEAHYDRRYRLEDFPDVVIHDESATAEAAPEGGAPRGDVTEEISAVIDATAFEDNDRSKHCSTIIRALVSVGWSDDEIAERLVSCPAGGHYGGKRKSALADAMRVRKKIEQGELPSWNANARGPARYEPPPWPRPLGEAAFYGLAGDIARAIEPYTEADPVAILGQLLVAFGSAVGRRNFHRVEDTRHHPNLFAIIVGDTSKARKGTSWGRVRRTLAGAELEDTWFRERVLNGGLSSGEGLIDVVRDAIELEKTDEKTGDVRTITEDVGVIDKRTLIVESEYARTLKAMGRADNTLSAVMREAWDGNNLALMTRKRPLRATDPHICIIGHITVEDLTRFLNGTDAANGFGNRNLYLCAKRSKKIADHENDEAEQAFAATIHPLQVRLKKAIEAAIDNRDREAEVLAEHNVRFDQQARARWIEAYTDWLSEGRPGMLGAVTNRGEAQVIRLSLIYALLDKSPLIQLPHMEAALEVWRYAEASAAFVFGDKLGDPEADEILALLRRAGPKGMKRAEIGLAMFGKHASSDKLSRALGVLARHRLATVEMESTPGRSAEIWRAT